MRKKAKGTNLSVNGASGEEKTLLTKKGLIKAYRDTVPLMTFEASTERSNSRRNAAATISKTDKYKNIEDGIIPFQNSTGAAYGKTSGLNIREAIILCQKAYYNVSVFRNTIDLMTEFSTSKIYYRGGSRKSRDFFYALHKKNGIDGLQDRFFREYYRSGNIFLLRYEGYVVEDDLRKINQAFGSEIERASKRLSLPVKYVILNPGDIETPGNVSFADVAYSKVLSDYELERLKNPKTQEDREVFESLPDDVKKKIKQKNIGSILIPLDKTKICAVFYKKQDYEPFSVPMGFPVLEDINWKMEMKKMDAAITRTMQQVLLLVTMGAKPEDGGVNQKHLEATQAFFQSTSLGKVLVADYTTKAEFVIPDIANLLDTKKYEVVNRDILQGLNNVFLGSSGSDGEKFANQSIKVKMFIERLKQAREVFLNEFLIPEIKRVAKELGFKNYPTPYFQDIDFKDELEYAKIYTQWLQYGALTPQEAIKAVETGQLPTEEDSVEAQMKFKALKDKGLYEPIIGGPATQKALVDKQIESQEKIAKDNAEIKKQEVKTQMNQPGLPGKSGRPTGTKAKKKTTAIGASDESDIYSLTKIKDNILLSSSLHAEVANSLKNKHGVKELNATQADIADKIAEIIIANEEPDKWLSKIADYLDNPIGENEDRVLAIEALAAEHNINPFVASILYASKK